MPSLLPWAAPATTGAVFSFARGLRLEKPRPPTPPRAPKILGSACWKASCVVYTDNDRTIDRFGALDEPHEVLGCPVGRTVGYGPGPEVARQAEEACRAHVAENLPKRGLRCGDAQLVMLPDSALDCSKAFFFEIGGKCSRIRVA
jgi:hypothetical protein